MGAGLNLENTGFQEVGGINGNRREGAAGLDQKGLFLGN